MIHSQRTLKEANVLVSSLYSTGRFLASLYAGVSIDSIGECPVWTIMGRSKSVDKFTVRMRSEGIQRPDVGPPRSSGEKAATRSSDPVLARSQIAAGTSRTSSCIGRRPSHKIRHCGHRLVRDERT